MSPPILRKYHDSVAFATGCKRIKNSKRCNRKIRIPIAVWPCRVEEKMTLKEVDRQTVDEIETKIIAKDDTITKRIEEEVEGRSGLSDLESTAKKWLQSSDSGKNNVKNNNENLSFAAIIARKLQTILPQIVTQVTNNSEQCINVMEENCGGGLSEWLGTKDALSRLPNLVIPRFHELAKLVPHLVTLESSRIKRSFSQHLSQDESSWGKLGNQFGFGGQPKYTKEMETKLRKEHTVMELQWRMWSRIPNVCKKGHGSFDVIVGMDWLSQHKVVIVCHEKVVEIPVEDGLILGLIIDSALGKCKKLLGSAGVARQVCYVCIDDILITTMMGWGPEVHLGLVVEIVKEGRRLYGTFSKCDVLVADVLFLGNVVIPEWYTCGSQQNRSEAVNKPIEKKTLRTLDLELGAILDLRQRGWIELFSGLMSARFGYHPGWNERNDTSSPRVGVKQENVIMEKTSCLVSAVEKERGREFVFHGFVLGFVRIRCTHDIRDMYWWGRRRDIATLPINSSIRCVSLTALYGRKCRTPVLWAEIGESSLIGPELVQETTDKVVLINKKQKAARDHQKSYANNRHKPLEF
ncbi:hypothetical protein Tco_0331205 [Tanacetum coccineum]